MTLHHLRRGVRSPRPMRPRSWHSTWRLLAGLGILCIAGPSRAQIAAPGDVYYELHVDQKFQYYVFAYDVITWENTDFAGTSLSATADHDSSLVNSAVGASGTFSADAGTFTADTDTHIDASAQTGIYHVLTNSFTVSVYIRGNTGTPFWIAKTGTGQVDASRLGGMDGSLQAVNGTSYAAFMDSSATVNYTGSLGVPVDESTMISGTTGAEIQVDTETYSFAHTFIFYEPASVSQNLCTLGCMTSPAAFHAEGGGHIELHVYPYTDPTGAPAFAAGTTRPSVQASPNPAHGFTAVSFRAPSGLRAKVQVFDVRGRLVTDLYEGDATGDVQVARWQPADLPRGLYFARVRAGASTSTAKIMLLR